MSPRHIDPADHIKTREGFGGGVKRPRNRFALAANIRIPHIHAADILYFGLAAVLMQGFTARYPRPAPHPGRFAPIGEKPFAFPRTPFAASARKASWFADDPLNSHGLRSVAAAELRQQLHSRPQCSGALGLLFDRQKANLARPLRARGRPARMKRVQIIPPSSVVYAMPRTDVSGEMYGCALGGDRLATSGGE